MDFIKEYKTMGHMTEAHVSSELITPVHYLPHHGIFRQSSHSTKRVVFNGSSRTSNGVCLNDILHAGPKLQTDICNVLLWTWTHRIRFSTNIVKMFRQITIHPDDRDLQRILWFKLDNQLTAYV